MNNHMNVIMKEERLNQRRIWPLIIMVAIIPFLMYEISYNPGLKEYIGYDYGTEYYDYFLAIKQCALFLVGLIMLTILGIDFSKGRNKIKATTLYIPLGIYLFFALLSAIFSINKKFAFLGGFEQFQGLFAIFIYCLTVIYAVQYVRKIEDVKFIMKRLLIFLSIMCVLGAFQFFGYDFLDSKIVKYLITPINEWNTIGEIQRNDLGSQVILTLYNPNYVGSYIALLLPLVLTLLYVSKNVKDTLRYSILTIGLIICLVGSGSATGMIGVVFEVILFIVLLRKPIIKKWYFSAPVLLLAMIVCLTPIVRNKLDSIIDSLREKEDSSYNLTEIQTNDTNVGIVYKGNTLLLSQLADDENLYGYAMNDDEYNTIEYTYDEDTLTYTIIDERFSGITIMPVLIDDILVMRVTIDGQAWDFTDRTGDGDSTYYYYTIGKYFDKIIVADSIGFEGYETLATGRGYLWSRTLPLLKDTILLGYGPDNFVFKFPTNDYVMRYNAGFLIGVVTKPHNMFLQIGVETGVISLIAFIIFYLGYFLSSIRLYFRSVTDSELKKYGVGIFVGTSGYMVAGLANDSMICVAPVFWGLIGIGIAVNKLIRDENNKKIVGQIK